MNPYYTLTIQFFGKAGKQRKAKNQGMIVPHDIPLSASPDQKYTEKSVFIDTVVSNFIKENDIRLERPEIIVKFTYSQDLGPEIKRSEPFHELSHDFIMTLAPERN